MTSKTSRLDAELELLLSAQRHYTARIRKLERLLAEVESDIATVEQRLVDLTPEVVER